MKRPPKSGSAARRKVPQKPQNPARPAASSASAIAAKLASLTTCLHCGENPVDGKGLLCKVCKPVFQAMQRELEARQRAREAREAKKSAPPVEGEQLDLPGI